MFKKYMEQIFVLVGHGHIWLLYAWPLDGSLFPFSLLFSLSTHMVNEPLGLGISDWHPTHTHLRRASAVKHHTEASRLDSQGRKD
jgi:hypothetical protein